MSNSVRWIATLGGPHILLAEELRSFWRGVEGWRDHADPLDQSDYARACRSADGWLGIVSCGEGQALILGGDVGQVAWFANSRRTGGFVVQWIYAENDNELQDALASPIVANALEGSDIETAYFSTGPSGLVRLFDSAEPGDDLLGNSDVLPLEPGRYRVRAAYIKTSTFAMVVREMAQA